MCFPPPEIMNNPSCISRKGKKRTTKQKLNKSLARQSNHSSWWVFHLAFFKSHKKWKWGVFSPSLKIFLELEDLKMERKGRDGGRLTWTSAYVLGKKDAVAGPWRANWDTEKARLRSCPSEGVWVRHPHLHRSYCERMSELIVSNDFLTWMGIRA